MKTIWHTALALAIALTATGPGALAQQPGQPPDEVVATVGADGVQRAEILGGAYFFKPQRVILAVNVPAELKVRREEGMTPHSLVVRAPEAGIDFLVELAAEPKTVSFTPTRAGVYTMYCDKRLLFFASHRERGMEGFLDVRE